MKVHVIAVALALTSSSVYAADNYFVSRPAFAAYEDVPNWTGFYAGVFGGVGAADYDFDIGPTGGAGVVNLDVSGGGLLAGVQVGADYQFSNFVIGAVADIAVSNIEGLVEIDTPAFGINGEIRSRLNYLGTVRARAGMLATEDFLVYGHGGFAYGLTEQRVEAGGTVLSGFDESSHWGYTIGAGLEYAVTENVSVQTEYAFTRFGEETIYSDFGTDVTEDVMFHTVKAGVNFRF